MERGTDPTPSLRLDRSWAPTGISAGPAWLPPQDASAVSHTLVTRCRPAATEQKPAHFVRPWVHSKTPPALSAATLCGGGLSEQEKMGENTTRNLLPPFQGLRGQHSSAPRQQQPRSRSWGSGFASPPGSRQGRDAQRGSAQGAGLQRTCGERC